MKLFGSLSELVNLIWRKDTRAITVRPNQTTTYTADRDIQLPQNDAAEVIVGRTSTDTGANRLLNKDFDDATTKIVDSSDTTKKIAFDAAGTTGTTTTIQSSQTTDRTWTLPDATDTAVGKATTDTLTNKILTSPAINTPNLDGGTASATSRVVVSKETNANLTALARKQATIYYDTTNNTVVFDNGTSLTTLSSTAVATASASGTVTSYVPVIKSATKAVSSADYPVLDNDGYDVILVTTGASDRTITLPTATDNAGRRLMIKKVDSGAGAVIIDGESSETVDGATTQTLTGQYGSVGIECDGTTWHIVSPLIAYASGTLDGDFTGGAYRAVRVGKMVTVTAVDPTWSGSQNLRVSTAALPASMWPTTETAVLVSAGADNAYQWGVRTDGTMKIVLRADNNLDTLGTGDSGGALGFDFSNSYVVA